MHEIHVTVVSPEEASNGTAEFWSAGRMIAFTRLEDGDLMLRIEPGRDGAAVAVGAHSLAVALAQAHRLLAPSTRPNPIGRKGRRCIPQASRAQRCSSYDS